MADIKMYSKDPCPYCDRARQFFENRGLTVVEIDLTGNEQELNKIKQETGWRTVPIIMINGRLVGGYTDLKELDASGELAQWLTK